MNDPILTLTLSVNEINAVLAGLQELPAKVCNPLSQKIQKEAQEQLQQLQPPTEQAAAE
jgi:hypothetical protein